MLFRFLVMIVFVPLCSIAQTPDELHLHDVKLTGPVKQVVERIFKADATGKKGSYPLVIRVLNYNEQGFLIEQGERQTEFEKTGYWETGNYRYRYDANNNLMSEIAVYDHDETYKKNYQNRKTGSTFYRTVKEGPTYSKTMHRYANDRSTLQEYIYWSGDTINYDTRIVYKWKGNKIEEMMYYRENGKPTRRITFERDQWGKELNRTLTDVITNQITAQTGTKYMWNDTWTNWTRMEQEFKEEGEPTEVLITERNISYYKNYDKQTRSDLYQYLAYRLQAGAGMYQWVSAEEDSFQVSKVDLYSSDKEMAIGYTMPIDDNTEYEYVYRFRPIDIVSIKEIPTTSGDKKILQLDLAEPGEYDIVLLSGVERKYLQEKKVRQVQLYLAIEMNVQDIIRAFEQIKPLW